MIGTQHTQHTSPHLKPTQPISPDIPIAGKPVKLQSNMNI